MKNKKNRLKWVDNLRIAAIVAIAFCGMLAVGKRKAVFIVLELMVLGLFLLGEFTLNRCPHCGRYLDRNRGQFCQHCGGRIREDEKDT